MAAWHFRLGQNANFKYVYGFIKSADVRRGGLLFYLQGSFITKSPKFYTTYIIQKWPKCYPLIQIWPTFGQPPTSINFQNPYTQNNIFKTPYTEKLHFETIHTDINPLLYFTWNSPKCFVFSIRDIAYLHIPGLLYFLP